MSNSKFEAFVAPPVDLIALALRLRMVDLVRVRSSG